MSPRILLEISQLCRYESAIDHVKHNRPPTCSKRDQTDGERILTNVAADFFTNSRKSAVDITGSAGHTGRGRQGDQRDDQEVLDETLTAFIVVELFE